MNNEQKPQEQHTREVFADLGSSIQQLRHHHGITVEQAAEAFLLWRGVRPDTAPVLAALR